jgi:acetyl esterase/lipase
VIAPRRRIILRRETSGWFIMRAFILAAVLLLCQSAAAADEIRLWPGAAPGSESWNWKEDPAGAEFIHNVVTPTLTVFRPEKNNGTAVLIIPGGGFQSVAWGGEGIGVARWLNSVGITAVILKYRVAHFPAGEVIDRPAREARQVTAIPFAKADAKQAIRIVRRHAAQWGVDKIGVMGFSAGGLLAIYLGSDFDATIRPDFVAGIYPATSRGLEIVPANAPPLFMAVAADDYMPQSLRAFDVWNKAKLPVELHIYAKGGHGFALRRQGLPVDSWTDRFVDWLKWLDGPVSASPAR